MSRFSENWRPADDSSEVFKREPLPGVNLYVPELEDGRSACPCGCGETPTGKNAIFRMGHDARLRGILIRAHLAEVPVNEWITDCECSAATWAMSLAQRHGWERYLRDAEMRREGKNREVVRRAMGAGDKLVKLGTWAHTGGQVAAVYRTGDPDKHLLEYVTRWGQRRTMRIKASETTLHTEVGE